MLSKFFLDRPVFAWVIAIILMVAGALAIYQPPVSQYPPIAPPSIAITAFYPGASAETVENSVTQLIEQNMLAGHRNANLEIKTTNADLNEIKRELADIKSKLNLMAGEFRTFAKRDDVKVVERYVNLWSPLNFVTAAEVEKIVRRLLDKDLSAENADDAKKR